MDRGMTRRGFLSLAGGTGAYVFLCRGGGLRAVSEAIGAENLPATFQFLTVSEALTAEAIASQIVPTDQDPGAREAGVVYYMDQALATWDKGSQKTYREGLAKVDEAAAAIAGDGKWFPDLRGEQQVELLKAMEGKKIAAWPDSDRFFGRIRRDTMRGFYGDPKYGGNKNRVGWTMMKFPGPVRLSGAYPEAHLPTEGGVSHGHK